MQSVIPLLKEYTAKLQDCVREADQLRDELIQCLDGNLNGNGASSHTEFRALRGQQIEQRLERIQSRVQRLTPPIEDLDRRVSQMIEHGQLDSELDRVELKLRLNDLEDALFAAQSIDTHAPPPA
jgi:hypothetical protein